MTPWKTTSRLLLVISSCFALFSSCGMGTTGSPATPTPSERTPTATSTAVLTPQPTSPASTCGAWNTVSSPNVGTRTNFLNAVAALSTNDVWAVGSSGDGQSSLTLVEHWNGRQWSIVKSPNIATLANGLAAVTVVSANDIWAVGTASGANTNISQSQSLIEHWNGTQWSIVKSPIQGESDVVNGIASISSKNITVVGVYRASTDLYGPYNTLVEHWNGAHWSVVNSPNPSVNNPGPDTNYNDLLAVAAVSDSSVWAVGYSVDSTGHDQTLTEFTC